MNRLRLEASVTCDVIDGDDVQVPIVLRDFDMRYGRAHVAVRIGEGPFFYVRARELAAAFEAAALAARALAAAEDRDDGKGWRR